MKDSQLIFGIMQNDERAWRYICREMKPGFVSILKQTFFVDKITDEDIDDIFQESLIVLMQKVKSGAVVSSHDGALFSYLVQIGKLTTCNLVPAIESLLPEPPTHALNVNDSNIVVQNENFFIK